MRDRHFCTQNALHPFYICYLFSWICTFFRPPKVHWNWKNSEINSVSWEHKTLNCFEKFPSLSLKIYKILWILKKNYYISLFSTLGALYHLSSLGKLFEFYCVRTRERAYYSVILWARSWWEWGSFSNFREWIKVHKSAKIRKKSTDKEATTNFWFFFPFSFRAIPKHNLWHAKEKN